MGRAHPSRTKSVSSSSTDLTNSARPPPPNWALDLSLPLEHADSARLDRHALAVVLEALGYVSYRRGSRITRKPSRPTADDLEKRAAQHVPDASPDSSLAQRADALPPLLNHRPCVDNGRAASTSLPRAARDSTPAPPGAPATVAACPTEHPLDSISCPTLPASGVARTAAWSSQKSRENLLSTNGPPAYNTSVS